MRGTLVLIITLIIQVKWAIREWAVTVKDGVAFHPNPNPNPNPNPKVKDVVTLRTRLAFLNKVAALEVS